MALVCGMAAMTLTQMDRNLRRALGGRELTEEQLATATGMNRRTVHSKLRRMERDGLVQQYYYHGSGRRVWKAITWLSMD